MRVFLFIFVLILSGCRNPHVEITDNGNLLFYNSPNIAEIRGDVIVAYMNSVGEIIVQRVDGKKTVVHQYSDEINQDIGTADDHAAPAIVFDEISGNIIVATAYHGTDLHLFWLDAQTLATKEHEIIDGQFTYPRFLQHEDDIFLVIRNQVSGSGDLVLLKASDSFETEDVVLSLNAGEYVYSGSPSRSKNGILFHYSLNSIDDYRLKGWVLSEYDTKTKEISNSCDLSHLILGNKVSNRPTGLSQNDGAIVAATAYFDEINFKKPEGAFTRENSVLVVKGSLDNCEGFSIIQSAKTPAPYYHTSVSVRGDLEYAFFSNGSLTSTANLGLCSSTISGSRGLYPTLSRGILYAKLNEENYQIRNFNNSLYYCE